MELRAHGSSMLFCALGYWLQAVSFTISPTKLLTSDLPSMGFFLSSHFVAGTEISASSASVGIRSTSSSVLATVSVRKCLRAPTPERVVLEQRVLGAVLHRVVVSLASSQALHARRQEHARQTRPKMVPFAVCAPIVIQVPHLGGIWTPTGQVTRATRVAQRLLRVRSIKHHAPLRQLIKVRSVYNMVPIVEVSADFGAEVVDLDADYVLAVAQVQQKEEDGGLHDCDCGKGERSGDRAIEKGIQLYNCRIIV